MDLHRRYHYSFIALMEPFRNPMELDQYKRELGFDNALVNCSGKIWLFWQNNWAGSVLLDSIQHVTMKFLIYNKPFIVTSVYARCTALDRLELWEELESIDASSCPWVVRGDFNVILHEEERLGGLDFIQQEATDFAQCINNYALSEVHFTGSISHGGMVE